MSPSSIVSTPPSKRLLSLDVIRGIALCGIAFANIRALWSLYPASVEDSVAWTVLNLVFQQRFFPVFSFLFGLGFAMIAESARRRERHSWVIMLRRLIPLAVLDVLHQLIHPGEALLPYAIVGMVTLLPLTFVPQPWRQRIALGAGIALTAVGAFLEELH